MANTAAIAAAQTTPVDPAAMARDPRLQQTVDVRLKRALLPELADYLKKHTDQHFAIDPVLKPLMVCAFAEKQPLYKIMNGVASVLGGRWTDLKSEWLLVQDPVAKSELTKYTAAESLRLRQSVFDRAQTLADLTAKRHFAESASSDTFQDGPDAVTAKQWAQSRILDKAYYVAGLMFQQAPLLTMGDRTGKPFKLDCPSDFTLTADPQAFTLGAPQNEKVAGTYMRVQEGSDQPDLAGTQILVRTLSWAGTFEAVDVKSGKRALRPRNLVALPKPVGDLAKSEAGRWILGWQSNLRADNNAWLDTPLPSLNLPIAEFAGKQEGIEEYLEALHNATHQTVISDAFRVPVIPDRQLNGSGTVRTWLAAISDSQQCFIRLEGDLVEVRHGGFWDLRWLEPDEDTLRSFEAIKKPDLNEYADFAIRLEDEDVGSGAPDPFFDFSMEPLVRFDPKPLRDSFNALLAYGQMSPQARIRFATGEWFDTIKIAELDYLIPSRPWTDLVRTKNGLRAVLVPNPSAKSEVPIGSQYDRYLNASARFGAFFGGQVEGREPLMLESMQYTRDYLDLTGRFPVTNFDLKMALVDEFCQAHLLILKSAPFNADDLRGDRKVLYGSFKFLAGFAEADGVVETIDIPNP